jgi:DNA topoisomerase-3
MSKALIIAEKPSVAADLARALGKAPGMSAFKKEKDWLENDTHVISSAIGHLVELGMPEVDGKKIGWGFTQLPIVPPHFELKPIEKTEDRFKLLKRLMRRKDVVELINACDAGREGELIFRYIVEAAGVDKPVRRMWMQSMTQGAILDAFQKLRSDEEMQPLADAAKCRSESDWLVGINATRAFTALNSRHGGFRLTPVGRVQTPTLTILAKREREIQEFVPRQYFEVVGTFGVKAGEYLGKWIDEAFKKDPADEHKKADRLWDAEAAQAIVDRCRGGEGVVEQTTKPARQAPPLLYDLTSLQREASNRFGFSARRTLQVAQALYEKFKVLTYPRTDSRYLPEDYAGVVRGTLKTFAGAGRSGAVGAELPGHAARVLDEQWVRPNRRIFDNSKVSDHFAIIPTGTVPQSVLPEAEQKIFDMVLRRFIAVFFPAAVFEVTTRITRVGMDAFRSDGKVLIEPGWLAVYGKQAAAEAAAEGEGKEGGGRLLTAARDGDKAGVVDVEARELMTKPPARFNEATLLGTMENAGKLVEDEELAEAMSERGLGTPATRAAIIEGLILDKYIERDGREFHVTAKGLSLIDQIAEIGIETLSSPEMTGQWEYKLRQMEHNQLDRKTFMRDIRQLTGEIVDRTKARAKAAKEAVLPELQAVLPPHGPVTFKQTEEFYEAKLGKGKLRIYKTVASRPLSEEEIRALIEKRVVGPLDGFRSKKGRDFTAALQIGEDNKVSFLFPEGEADPEAVNWDEAEAFAPCPVCEKAGRKGQMIYDTPDGYMCKLAATPKGVCNARLPKELCRKTITPEDARRFFTEGKTGLIEGMISKKGRPFKAFLICNIGDKRLLGWEFPPREARKGPAKKAAKKSAD